MSPYEQLLHLAFHASNDVRYYLTPTARQAYDRFRRAARPEQPFYFEQVRLGLALALLKLFADLGDNYDARALLDVLHRALNDSRSPEDIDRIISRDAKLFDRLYDNLYVNDEGEELMNLFGQTLEADVPQVLEEVALAGVALARTLDFTREEDEE